MKYVFLTILIVFTANLNKIHSQACLNNYQYRVPISVPNLNASVLTNFQVKVLVNTSALITAGKLRIDGGDVRFTDGSGTNLSYWFDPATFNFPATEYWVKVNNLALGANTIYLFYGNATVPVVASGDATFEYFDEFSGTVLDNSKWNRCGDITNVTLAGGIINFSSNNSAPNFKDGIITSLQTFGNNVIVETDVVSVNQGKAILGFMTAAEEGYATTFEKTTGVDIFKLSRITTDAVTCQILTDILPTSAAGTLSGIWSFSWPTASSQTIGWASGVSSFTYADAIHSGVSGNQKKIILGSHINASTNTGTLAIDWLRVRKLAIDPITVLGAEQEYPVSPNPTNTGPYCNGSTIQFNSTSYSGAVYTWKDPSNGTFSTISNPTISGSTIGNTGTYTLEIAVPGCAPVVTTTFVDVSNSSNAGVTSGTTTVCSGTNGGTVSVAGITGSVVRWEMANNIAGPWFTISSSATSMTYANLLQTTLFRPIVKTTACPEAVGTAAVITVDNATVGGFVIGGNSVCAGTNSGTVNLVFQSGTVTKWQFSIDGGLSWTDIVSNSTSYSFTNISTTTLYRAEVKNGSCPAQFSAAATVIVNPLPVPGFSVATVCESVASNFVNTTTIASGSIANYQWDFGNSSSSISANPIYIYPNYGIYFVQLTAVSSAGCTASTSSLVTVNAAPDVFFNAASVCQGSPTNFQAIAFVPGGGSISNYFWDHDDASTSTVPIHSYTYSSTGVYDVLLVATSNNGCIDSVRNAVEVAAPVSVSFIADSVCLGTAINFINTSATNSPSVSYTWDFGNGNNSTLLSPIYSYPVIGTYTVTLQAQVVGSPSACVSSTQRTVVIYEVPNPNFTLANVCLIDSASFTNLTFYTGNPTDLSYSWNFGDATTETLTDPFHTYVSPGNFNVQLTASTIDGCSATNTQLISIHPMPTANFAFTDVCLNTNMNFTSTATVSSGTLTHAWDFDDASTSPVQNPIHLYGADGTYDVELIVTTNNNCRDTIVKTVTVFPRPFVDFINTPVCDGQPSTFTESTSISGGTVVSFDWDYGDGSSANGNSTVYQYLNPGTYNVTLTSTSNFGCTHDTTKAVIVDAVPVPNFTAADACFGAANQFTNTSSVLGNGPLTHLWRFGDGGTSVLTSPGNIYPAPGFYNVTLVVTTGAGCVDSIIKVTEVYALPTVNAGNDTTISKGNEVQLNGYDPAAISYSWTPVATLDVSAIPNPIARPTDTTTYTLTLTDFFGCQNTDDMTINVLNDFKILIHNVITPDGNGQNDVWYITNIDFYPEATVQLFNRWGELIYETLNYQNDWNGVVGTDQLPDGTYYYIITFPDSDIHYKGAVTLLRNN